MPAGGGGQPGDDPVADLVGEDQHDQPARIAQRPGQPLAAPVEAGAPAEAGGAQRGEEGEGLDDDAGGGAEAEQPGLGGAQAVRAVVGEVQEEPEDGDDDDVVEDRGPHHRAEPAAGVQHLPEEGEQPVEEDLREAVPGERDGGARLGPAVGGVRGHDQRGGEHGGGGQEQQRRRAGGQQPVGVRGPAVLVLLGGPDQLGDEDGVERAADEQHVEDVRDGVGDGVGVAEQPGAERGDDDGGADEAGGAGDDGAGRHERAAAQHRGLLRRRGGVVGVVGGVGPAGRGVRSGVGGGHRRAR